MKMIMFMKIIIWCFAGNKMMFMKMIMFMKIIIRWLLNWCRWKTKATAGGSSISGTVSRSKVLCWGKVTGDDDDDDDDGDGGDGDNDDDSLKGWWYCDDNDHDLNDKRTFERFPFCDVFVMRPRRGTWEVWLFLKHHHHRHMNKKGWEDLNDHFIISFEGERRRRAKCLARWKLLLPTGGICFWTSGY